MFRFRCLGSIRVEGEALGGRAYTGLGFNVWGLGLVSSGY